MNTPQHLQQRLRKQFRKPYDHMVVTIRKYLFPHNRNIDQNFLLIRFQFIEGPTFRDHQCMEKCHVKRMTVSIITAWKVTSRKNGSGTTLNGPSISPFPSSVFRASSNSFIVLGNFGRIILRLFEGVDDISLKGDTADVDACRFSSYICLKGQTFFQPYLSFLFQFFANW